MKRLLYTLFILLAGFCSLPAQQVIGRCEYELLIKPSIKQEAAREGLMAIYDSILHGRYPEAKASIKSLKATYTGNTEVHAALLNYQAQIAYNESDYGSSIALCDAALLILNPSSHNGYALRAMNTKAKAQAALNRFAEATAVLEEAIALAKKQQQDYCLSSSYYVLGSVYSDQGFYDKGNAYALQALALKTSLNDVPGIAACYSFIGLNLAHLGNYSEGIEKLQQSIAIREKINDKRGLANSYLNLYKIYYEIGEYDKALQSELHSLHICRELNDLQCVSGRLTNLGQLYQYKGNYKQALAYHFEALAISRQINIPNRIALVHENIARVYNQTFRLEEALKHIDSSLVIRRSIGDNEGELEAMLVQASVLLKQNKIAAVTAIAEEVLARSKHLQLPLLQKNAHELLARVYEQTHDTGRALKHYQQFIALRDSLYNIDKTKEITRKQLEFEFNQKSELTRLKQEAEMSTVRLESERRKQIAYASVAGSAVLLLCLVMTVWQYRLSRQARRNLTRAYDTLEEKNQTIELQHEVIRQKNQETTDSIRYACTIQSAIMPTAQELGKYFKESFVLFKPRDIISGDFYWISEKDNKIIFVTADCTGHGVPGGFMSMLGVSFLSEIVNEHNLTEPALILSRLRKKVITALKQKGISGENQDGMDMLICVFDRQTLELQYAAANHHFYVLRQEATGPVLSGYQGDKQPVGIFGKELSPFGQKQLQLQPGDVLITLSDGYADQFGGPKGKKFKYKQLEELLIQHAARPLSEQGAVLDAAFETWRGKLEQVDDVTLIGVRV